MTVRNKKRVGYTYELNLKIKGLAPASLSFTFTFTCTATPHTHSHLHMHACIHAHFLCRKTNFNEIDWLLPCILGEWTIREEKKKVKGHLEIPEFSFGELDDLQVHSLIILRSFSCMG